MSGCGLTGVARRLRKAMTEAERQVPLGPHVLDFVCFAARLVVEVDGGQHFGSRSDAARDAYLRDQGFRVLRFWNSEGLGNVDGVLAGIVEAVPRPPAPSREGRGRAGRTRSAGLDGDGLKRGNIEGNGALPMARSGTTADMRRERSMAIAEMTTEKPSNNGSDPASPSPRGRGPGGGPC